MGANPISNLAHGHLMESMMLQSQRMKVLMKGSLHSVDSVMQQLKWDFLMAGVMPMISLCTLGYWCISSAWQSRARQRRHNMIHCLAKVDRFFNKHSESLQATYRPFQLAKLGPARNTLAQSLHQ